MRENKESSQKKSDRIKAEKAETDAMARKQAEEGIITI